MKTVRKPLIKHRFFVKFRLSYFFSLPAPRRTVNSQNSRGFGGVGRCQNSGPDWVPTWTTACQDNGNETERICLLFLFSVNMLSSLPPSKKQGISDC